MRFPNENISNTEKDDYKFGQKVGEVIASQWFADNRFTKRNKWIDKMRAFARGEHDMEYQMKLLCGKFQTHSDYAGVDFKRKLKVLPKFMNLLINNLDNDVFSPKVYALDPTALEKKKKVRKTKLGLMMAKNVGALDEMQRINPSFEFDPDNIEDDMEEIDLNMNLFYKEPIEKSEELFIKAVLLDNHYSRIRKRAIKDGVTTGFMGLKLWTHPRDGIQISYVNSRNAVWDKTTDPYFQDCKYMGEVVEMNIDDALELSEIDLTVEEIKKLKSANPLEENKVKVCYFAFKTTNEKIYKKKHFTKDGRKIFKMIDKTKEGFKPGEHSTSERIVDEYQVWYHGIMIVGGINKVISYNKVQNMAEYKGKVLPPFIFHAPEMDEDGKLHSMVERTTNIIESLQFVEIKIQQLTSELRPNVIDINLDSMIENASNPKVKMSVEEQTALFLLKGVRYSKSVDEDGNPIYQKSIREEAPAANHSLERLGNEAARLLNQLRNVLGYNEFTDGSTPHPKSLNKVAEMARLSSNLSIKHYVDAVIELDVMVWENITSRLNDIFKYSDVKKKYISMIGDDDIKQLNELKDRSIHYFGVFAEPVPKQEEISNFNEMVSLAYKEGTLGLEDVSVLERIKDIRVAEMLFRIRRKKYIKSKEKQDMMKIMANADANAKSSEKAESFKQQTALLKSKLEQEKLAAENFYKLRTIEAQTQSQLMIDSQDFEGRKILEQMETEQMIFKEKYRKDREEEIKMKGINLTAMNQAKLNEQKKYGIDPNFGFIPYDSVK